MGLDRSYFLFFFDNALQHFQQKESLLTFNDPYLLQYSFIWPATWIETKQNEPTVAQHCKSKESDIRA